MGETGCSGAIVLGDQEAKERASASLSFVPSLVLTWLGKGTSVQGRSYTTAFVATDTSPVGTDRFLRTDRTDV